MRHATWSKKIDGGTILIDHSHNFWKVYPSSITYSVSPDIFVVHVVVDDDVDDDDDDETNCCSVSTYASLMTVMFPNTFHGSRMALDNPFLDVVVICSTIYRQSKVGGKLACLAKSKIDIPRL